MTDEGPRVTLYVGLHADPDQPDLTFPTNETIEWRAWWNPIARQWEPLDDKPPPSGLPA